MSPRALSFDSTRLTVLAAVLLLGPAFSGCLAGDGDGTGTAAFYVKDAPTDDFEHINVTFTKVSVHAADDGSDGNETEDEEDDGNQTDGGDGGGAPDSSGDGWITVFEGQRTVDLLDYNASEARALLGAAQLEAGTYNQVVIHVESAHGIHADDGSREDFTVTTGWVKLTRAWTIDANQTTHVTADFDLDRSIVKMGPNGYRLNPVVGQVLVDQDDSEPASEDPDDEEDEAEGNQTQGDEAQASMYVKDAPTDEFSEVWVRFDEVQVHLAGDDNETEENGTDANETEDDEADGNQTSGNETDGNQTDADRNETTEENETSESEDDGEWITAVNESRAVDLLRYSDPDARAFLGDASLPEGKYTQIRVNVTEAWGIDNETGENETITVASESAKINRPWRLEANGTVAQVTIDLNLDRSLKERGNQGWLMTPVIGSVVMDWADEPDRQDRPDEAGNGTSDGDGDETQQDQDASGPSEQGNTTAYVKDAPTDEFREIWLTFDSFEVHLAGDDNETEENSTDENTTAENDTEEDDGEWVSLFDGTRSVNLLNYSQNGSKAFLGDAELDAGRYTHIRINVTDAWGVDADSGENETITVSSGTARVVQSFNVTANDTTQVVVDLDLDRSLTKQGQSYEESWRMSPVVGNVLVDHVEEDPRADQADS